MRFQRLFFILFAVYVVFIGGSPYYYTIFPVRVLHHIVMSVVFGAWLLRRLRDGLPITPLNAGLYAAVGVWLLSAVFSADPRMAFENLWFPFVHLLLFFVIAHLFQRGRQRLVMETQFMLATLTVFMALLQFASWLFGWGIVPGTEVGWLSVLNADVPIPLRTPQIYLPLGVSTWLGAYVAPLILLAFGWSLTARQRDFRLVLRGLSVALLLVLVLTLSRGGFISLATGIGLFIVLRVSQSAAVRQLNLQRLATVLVPILVIAGAAAVIVLTISQSSARASGDVLRLNLWQSAVGIARDNPVLGIGPGLFGRGARLYRDPTYVDDRLGTAHNILLNTAAEEGLLGLAVLGVLGVLTFRAWWRLWRHADSTTRRLRLEVALAALAGISVQSLFDTFTTTPLVALISLLAVYCTVEPGSVLDKPRGSRAAAGVALVCVVLYGIFWVQSDRAQSAFNRSVRMNDRNAAQEAAGIDPSLRLYPLQIAYLTAQQLPPDADLSPAIQSYEQALMLEPTWDTGWINLAALQERAGDIDGALASLEHAERINLRNAAAFNHVRFSEAHALLPDDELVQLYADIMPRYGLPLSGWWSETDVRRRAVEQYYATLSESPDLQYRIAEVHFPERLSELVSDDPQTAAEWAASAMYALDLEHDSQAAMNALDRAIALNGSAGDYYVLRAQTASSFMSSVERDLNLATLLGTTYESVNTARAALATGDERERLLITAVPPRIINQNFEGVLFGGRTALFALLPEMRLPGPGTAVMQPWYDLAALYETEGRIDEARNVYRAILDYAPDEQLAQERLAELEAD